MCTRVVALLLTLSLPGHALAQSDRAGAGGLRERMQARPVQRRAATGSAAATAAPGATGVPTVPPLVATSCFDAVEDMAQPGTCLPASSVPALGALYPLGPELNIDPLGRVGIGTLGPQSRLHVAGDMLVEDGAAFGNIADLDVDPEWWLLSDFSEHVTDFSGPRFWTLMYSTMKIEPQIDQTGADARYIYSHVLGADIEPGNSRDIEYLQGPWIGVSNWGSGKAEVLAGALSVATAFGTSHSVDQSGLNAISDASHQATIDKNYYFAAWGGHRGNGGKIVNNYGIYLFSPYASRPLENHSGLYLENQDFGQDESCAIWSGGGTCYFAGDVGIGTPTPLVKLQVGTAGDGTEARANAWNLLSSRAHKRDVEALDAAECAAVLREIVAQDVVRYRFADDPDAEQHLGVIAEDSPAAILGKDRKSVSLGDWNAHLMAGIQAQQARIDELDAAREAQAEELAALRAELASLRETVGGKR